MEQDKTLIKQAEGNFIAQPQEHKRPFSVKKLLLWIFIPLAIIIAFVTGFFSRYFFIDDKITITTDILTLIDRQGYVYDPVTKEERAITEEDIADLLVSGFLDQYSAYYTKEEYDVVNQNAKGSFSGVGISFDGKGVISTVTLNSPADLAGVAVGDKMYGVSVDGGEQVLYSTNDGKDFKNALTIEDGQAIKLTIERNGSQLTFDMVKRVYVAAYVQYFDSEKNFIYRENAQGKLVSTSNDGGLAQLDGDTAYISLAQFNGKADEELKGALEYMASRGRSKLILDLRDNGGGYMSILRGVSSYLIYNGGQDKTLIAYSEGKNTKESYYATGNNFFKNLTSISVIANEGTASASECLIGAMLHYKDCFDQSKLVIEKNDEGVAKTYGKGIMQNTYPLLNGGALKLTTAKIYHPDKTTSIHDVGFIVTGDNAVDSSNALARAIAVLG